MPESSFESELDALITKWKAAPDADLEDMASELKSAADGLEDEHDKGADSD